MSKVGRTNAASDRVLVVSSPHGAVQKNSLVPTTSHTYAATLGGSELNVSSLQRIVSRPPLRRKLRVMGGKISKNLCHPSINAFHRNTEPPFSMNNIRKLCGRSVPIIRCRSTSNNS